MAVQTYPAATTLNTGINSSITTIVLTTAVGFVGSSYLVMGTEIIDISGATLDSTQTTYTNAVRGALGTTAAAHLAGVTVYGLFSSDFPLAQFSPPNNYLTLIAIQLGVLQSMATAAANQGIRTQTVVTGSRVIGTVYQNTGKTPMFVSISVTPDAAAHQLNALTDSAATPTTNVGSVAGDGTATERIQLQFWVLPGNFYEAALSAGTYTLNNWTEWQ